MGKNMETIEQKLKYYAESNAQSNPQCGVLGKDVIEPMRDNLRGRIADQRQRAERESRRAMALAELEYLLDKNPEFARILDLLEEVKG